MTRWNKSETRYTKAAEHYDLEYFKDQSRDGDLRGILNAWKFEKYSRNCKTILDFGCGDGNLLQALGGSNGVEVNPHAAEAARARGFHVEERIDDFPDDTFDLIISNHCLEHVESPLTEIRGMRCAIKDDGVLVLVVPCHRAGFRYNEQDRDYHLYSWSEANLGNLVKLAGFEVVETKELLHRWPPKWRTIIKYLGFPMFNTLSRLWARVDRSSSQVICVAKPLRN